MILRLFLLLSISTVCDSRLRVSATTNSTDLQVAMNDMRSRSYYGFVILLQMLERPAIELGNDITFLMPSDRELAKSSISTNNIREFLLSHSIPTPVYFNNILHFPTGTMVPSSLPDRMIKILNHGRSGFFVNNARIVAPNVCLRSMIKCHGINAVIRYTDRTVAALPATLPPLALLPPPLGPALGSSNRGGGPAPLALNPEITFSPTLSEFSQAGSGGFGASVEHGCVGIFLSTSYVLLLLLAKI